MPPVIFLIMILLDSSLTVKAATLIFISGCGSAVSSAEEGKSGLFLGEWGTLLRRRMPVILLSVSN